MPNHVKIDVSSGRFSVVVVYDDKEYSRVDIAQRGDLTANVSNGLLKVQDSEGKIYFQNVSVGIVKKREIGSTSFSYINTSSAESDVQEILDRSGLSVISDSEYNIDDFVKPDLTSGHAETTQFVHNGDVDRGGAVILDSNSALIGFQSGTYVKTTENILGGRAYGRIQVKVDNGAGTGTAVDAIDITQGNIVLYTTVSVYG